jgi:single-strand DNA-binding protein
MKSIVIAGNITKDAVMRRTQSGEPVTGFSVAVNDHRDKDKTLFFDCSLWGKRGDALIPYLKKGAKVCVSGELGIREHDGRTYLTVNANEVSLMGGLDKQREDRPARQERNSYGDKFSDQEPDQIPF